MNFFRKICLKLKDKEQYKTEKEIYRVKKANRKFVEKASHVPVPNFYLEKKAVYSFKHSGNGGDIIYSLPTVYALAEKSDVEFYLNLDRPADYARYFKHPLGQVMLNQKMFDMMRHLLLSQPQIKKCEIYRDESVDYDLDIFREYPFPLDRGNIARWYFLTFAVNADLGKPWLFVEPNHQFKDYIVIARSNRYHSPAVDYSFLKKYKNLICVGLPEEFEILRQAIPNLEYKPVNDFLELACVLAGCKFFIGNQGLPFALADGLKIKRLLEVPYLSPVVCLEGINGFDFCYQPQFERLVEKVHTESI